MSRIVAAILLVLAMTCGTVDAQFRTRSACYPATYSYYPAVQTHNYYQGQGHNYHYQEPYYPPYKEINTTVFLGVPLIPYSLGYSNPDTSLKLDILQLKLENSQLQNQFLQLQLKQVPQQPTFAPNVPRQEIPPMPKVETSQVPLGDGGKLIMQDCAGCHDVTTKSKGGGLVLTQAGSPLRYDLATQAKIMRELYLGRMPPGKKYDGPEGDKKAGSIFVYLDQLK